MFGIRSLRPIASAALRTARSTVVVRRSIGRSFSATAEPAKPTKPNKPAKPPKQPKSAATTATTTTTATAAAPESASGGSGSGVSSPAAPGSTATSDLDHRVVGKSQGLFMFHPYSAGSAFFMPHGTRIYNTLLDFLRAEYRKRGYDEVRSPLIYDKQLWMTSGHWENYKENMYIIEPDREQTPPPTTTTTTPTTTAASAAAPNNSATPAVPASAAAAAPPTSPAAGEAEMGALEPSGQFGT